jgi:hypothetical protein
MSLVQASRFRRRIPFVLFALFLAGVAAVTGLWFVGAEMVREQITSFGRDLAAEGGAFTTSSLRITGFPFSFTAHATDIRMSGRNRRGLWHWQAARGSARLSPWRVDDVSFDLAGAHRLRFHAGPVPLAYSPAAPLIRRAWSPSARHRWQCMPRPRTGGFVWTAPR